MTLSFTKEWGAADTITADDLNGNFNDVADIINGGVKNQHISTSANIAASKIADRFHIVKTVLNLVPFSGAGTEDTFANGSGTTAAATVGFHVPIADAVIARHEIIAQSGMEGHLMAIGIYVRGRAQAGSKDPAIKVQLNGTLVGQKIILEADDTFYRLHASNPFSNPLLALADGDIINFVLVAEDETTANIEVSGVWATIYERWSIGS